MEMSRFVSLVRPFWVAPASHKQAIKVKPLAGHSCTRAISQRISLLFTTPRACCAVDSLLVRLDRLDLVYVPPSRLDFSPQSTNVSPTLTSSPVNSGLLSYIELGGAQSGWEVGQGAPDRPFQLIF
jgi:hypothetical protein